MELVCVCVCVCVCLLIVKGEAKQYAGTYTIALEMS